MACKVSHARITTVLIVYAVLSLIVSLGGIGLWIKNCYDVFLVSDARQSLRLFILHQVDKDLERILDEKMPGPKGHRGTVTISEPPEFIPEFDRPIGFIGIGVGIMVGQVIQILLAIWLLIVVKTKSQAGVRVWFICTSMIVIGTIVALGMILGLSSFHGVAVVTTVFLVLFYVIGLCITFKYKVPLVPRIFEMESVPTVVTATNEKKAVPKKSEYMPVNSRVSSFCGVIGSCML